MGASEFLAIRTRFYDDYLLRACTAGIRQVVLLAAGLDTRAFRLAWPAGVRLFELDLPALFGFKQTVLADQAATATCDTRIPELGTHYGRPLPDFVDPASANATILCTATRAQPDR